ncbi:MAG: hypothetical protein Q7W45_07260 [Bacteroidota bacterium]|nr:hypothetical protein [Bacteroidota bacterium]
MQSQINELAPTLELFLEETIQPSVDSCEILQKQLSQLQENLAVYKYNKINKEISPSFSLHAKVSEKEIPQQTTETPKEETKIPEKEIVETVQPFIDIIGEITHPSKTIAPFTIGINDKFRLINELFKQNNAEYNIAIEQLSALKSWSDSEVYLNSLKTLYNWKEDSEVVIYFFSITKKRFS